VAKPYTFGLPLIISPNEVSNCFIEDFMSSIPNDIRFQKYADYLVDTYICEDAKFPPICAANIASLALTRY